ncbi:MAG TPA: SLC13 family permease [Polyangiaceae bacterium]|nr:SLC13 family permease [Polyangiaceae bacterium]
MLAGLIFAVTYVAFAIGRIPGLRSDRIGASVVGGALMVAAGVLSFHDAERTVDGATLALLFGMMVLSAALDVSGAFAAVGHFVLKRAGSPRVLLVLLAAAAAVLSALMINDVVCLAFTPLVLRVCDALELEAKPYLVALATSSNIGSVATITGNPQNILIASLSHVTYRHFATLLLPVALLALAVNTALVLFVYRDSFPKERSTRNSGPPPAVQRAEAWKGAIVSLLVLVAFIAGAPPALAALLGGAAMLLTRTTRPEELYARVDWTLLALFTGLFVVVGGGERAGLAAHLLGFFSRLRVDTAWGLASVTAILSNLVSNVPAVMVLKGSIPHTANPEAAWVTLAMASTLAGNLTLPASLATIIVVERAKHHTRVSLWDFCKVGTPSALFALAFGTFWLWLVAY